MRAMKSLLVGVAGLFVAACLPVTSEHPIGESKGFAADPALLGVWRGRGENKEDKPGTIAFLRGEGGHMTAILIAEDDWETYDLQVATLGANHIMNARSVLKNGEPVDGDEAKAIIPLLYRFGRDGKLTLSLLDDKASAAAIRAGKIKGESKADDDAHLTAEPKELDAFFATKEGASLFKSKLLTLTKVK